MSPDAKNVRAELRKVLALVKGAPSAGLEWVSKYAGVPLEKVEAFLAGDDKALADIECHFLLDWYYFAGPT